MEKLKRRLGLILLLLFLTIINFSSLKPQFYLVGWDNFSSYFNLKTNLFRTFLATWREYRGLGVPSDSEVVDIFRQLFYLALSPFLKAHLLGQVYVFLCLDIGVLGMYFFVKRFLEYVFTSQQEKNFDLPAFAASFFYLFNLNTLATFYFPMIMYLGRFAALPFLFWTFFRLVKRKSTDFRDWLLAILAFLFISPSYLTATVFVTFLFMLSFFGLFLGNYKRQILIFLVFIGTNLFWLLPFANYTLEKSSIIKLSPTFIEVNESQLNKSAFFYSADRLLLLYPNFFDTKITDIANNESHSLYPWVEFFNGFWPKAILFIFPFFYLTGSALILVKSRRKEFFWIPLVIAVCLFLVGKEYTPFGFIYSFIESLIPYFDVLFRLADTKFNIFIAFAGSLAACLPFVLATDQHSAKIKKTIRAFLLILLLPTAFVFSSYFRGNLVGFFMYNQIPNAYFEMAEIINHDEDNFRVLHLPLSRVGYWRSHVWGMVGSSFLNFILDKSLIDRTFEPASMENAYLHQAIFRLTDNAQAIESQKELEKRSTQLYQVLRKTGVKYVIWDETVSNAVYPRGVSFWGKFDFFDDQKIIDNLKTLGYLQTQAEYQINILDYLDFYTPEYPLDQSTLDHLGKSPYYSLQLLEVKNPLPKVYFASKAKPVDTDLDSLLATGLISPEQNYLQSQDNQTQSVFPFQRENIFLNKTSSSFSFNLKNPFENSDDYLLESVEDETGEKRYFLLLSARIDQEKLIIGFQRLPFPIIQDIQDQTIVEDLGRLEIPLSEIEPAFSETGEELGRYFSDWQILDYQHVGRVRLEINGFVFPLPPRSELGSENKHLGTIVASGNKLEVEILLQEQTNKLNLDYFQLTENPNCFQDKIADYQSSLDKTENKLSLLSQNGSTCFWRDLTPEIEEENRYWEVAFDLEAKSEDMDGLYSQNLKSSSKPLLKNYLLEYPKPNILRICLKGGDGEECLNKHQVLDLEDKQAIIVPLDRLVGAYQPSILLAAKSLSFQEQKITFNSLILNQFRSIYKSSLEVKPPASRSKIRLDSNKEVEIEIPKALSPYTYYFDPQKDGFYFSNQPCTEEKNAYRTFRLVNDALVSYFENCSNLALIQNNFDSGGFYLWNIDYHLFSGKYPKYILDDGFHFYQNDYLSIGQGYPEILFFKSLQKPEGFLTQFNPAKYQEFLTKEFTDIPYQSAYTYIYPQPELGDQKVKDYTLHHDSENEGVLALADFEILELPTTWQNLAIRKLENSRQYDLPEKFEFHQLLPSLWKIDLEANLSDNPLLLVFNEGYDRQWQAYESFLDIVLGKKLKGFDHLKFNGYANAWEIENPAVKDFYLLYTPEKLAVTGWLMVVLVVLMIIFVFPKVWPKLGN